MVATVCRILFVLSPEGRREKLVISGCHLFYLSARRQKESHCRRTVSEESHFAQTPPSLLWPYQEILIPPHVSCFWLLHSLENAASLLANRPFVPAPIEKNTSTSMYGPLRSLLEVDEPNKTGTAHTHPGSSLSSPALSHVPFVLPAWGQYWSLFDCVVPYHSGDYYTVCILPVLTSCCTFLGAIRPLGPWLSGVRCSYINPVVSAPPDQ